MSIIPQEQVKSSDLIIGSIYEGGPTISSEPISTLLGVGNMGGIRPKVNLGATSFVALLSTNSETEWPDGFDGSNGSYTYFGDNRSSGRGLLEPHGNKAFHRVFEADFSTQEARLQTPPFFIFSIATGHPGRSVKFEGLGVPGDSSNEEDWCVAKFFKDKDNKKFLNFQIRLTILADHQITATWIADLAAGEVLTPNCPAWYANWINTGRRVPYTY